MKWHKHKGLTVTEEWLWNADRGMSVTFLLWSYVSPPVSSVSLWACHTVHVVSPAVWVLGSLIRIFFYLFCMWCLVFSPPLFFVFCLHCVTLFTLHLHLNSSMLHRPCSSSSSSSLPLTPLTPPEVIFAPIMKWSRYYLFYHRRVCGCVVASNSNQHFICSFFSPILPVNWADDMMNQ